MKNEPLCSVLHLSESVKENLDRIVNTSSNFYITGELCKNISGFNLACSDFNKGAMAVFDIKPFPFMKDHYFPLNEYMGADNVPHNLPDGLYVFIRKKLAESVRKDGELACIELDLAKTNDKSTLLLANYK